MDHKIVGRLQLIGYISVNTVKCCGPVGGRACLLPSFTYYTVGPLFLL